MPKVTFSMLALFALAACGRSGARSSDFDSATAAALATGKAAAQMANTPKTAHIAALELGHSLDKNSMIFGGVTNRFNVGDSVLVAVKGIYLVAGADVSARIRQKNTTIDSVGVKAGAADTAGFTQVGLRFASEKKWTKGSYLVEVFLDGKFQVSRDFTYGQ